MSKRMFGQNNGHNYTSFSSFFPTGMKSAFASADWELPRNFGLSMGGMVKLTEVSHVHPVRKRP